MSTAFDNMVKAGYRNMTEFERPRDAVTAGYPVHVVIEFRERINPNGGVFTDWRAVCGARDTRGGGADTTLSHRLDRPRKLEWCVSCNPTRDIRGAHISFHEARP